MDEKGFDDYTVELGAKIRPDTNSKVNKFIKAINKIPENRELRLRINKKNTLSKALNKELKTWNSFEKKATSGLNLFKGRRQLMDIKNFYSKMRRTALSEMRKLESELSTLTDKTSNDPRNIYRIIGELEKQRSQIEQNRKKQEEYQNTIKETREQLENLGKIRQPNAIRADIMKIQSRLNQNLKRRSKDNVLGDVKSTQERNIALTENNSKFYNAARDAALYRNRNVGQEGFKYFRELKKWTDWSAQSDTLKNLEVQAKDVEAQFNLATMSYEKLLEEQKNKGAGTDTILDEDVEHAKKQVESLRAQLAGFQKQKYAIQLEIDMRKANKKQYDQFFAGSRDPEFMKQFGRAQTPSRDSYNVKLKQLENSYASGIRKSTEPFMSPIDNDKLMADIQADETEVRRLQDELSKLNSNDFKAQVEELQTKLTEAETNFKNISKEIVLDESNEIKLNRALEETQALITDIETKADLLKEDMRQNPQQAVMMNEGLAKAQQQLDTTKKKMNGFQRFAFRIFRRIGTNIVSQIASLINPITNVRKAWSAWLDRTDNKAWANTFEMIKYNLVTAIAPMLEKIAKLMLKIAAIANVFTKKFAGVDLFDKSAWSAEKFKKEVDSVTSSLDELHDIGKTEDDSTIFDTGTINTDNLLSANTEKSIEQFADKAKSIWNNVTSFVKEHPFITAGLIGAWLTKGLWGPAVLSLVGKGLGNLFGGNTATTAATTAGTSIGQAFGGAVLTTAGAIGTYFQSSNMAKNWDKWTLSQKAGNTALFTGATAATVFGTALMGLNPIVGGVISTVALTAGSFKAFYDQCLANKNGIESLAKEQEKLIEIQANLAEARNYETQSLQNLTTSRQNLTDIEEAYHMKGEDINRMVQDGTLKIENMTNAQLQVYNAYIQATKAMEDYKEITKIVTDLKQAEIDKTWDLQIAQAKESKNWNKLKEDVITACEQQEISVEQAQDILAKAMAEMNTNTKKTFTQDLPDYIKQGLNPKKYESDWNLLGDNFGEKLKNLFTGAGNYLGTAVKNWGNSVKIGWQNDGLWGAIKGMFVPQYDVGTNYVPNDQLAYVHQGEAIIPAKYNKGYQPNDNGLTATISELRMELTSLRMQIAQGINVSGEFKQRGSDLVAVVEKGKNRSGNQALSNPAYAR